MLVALLNHSSKVTKPADEKTDIMSAQSYGIRIIAPNGSRRGRKLRGSLARLRNSRAIATVNAKYNHSRQEYYKSLITKQNTDGNVKVSIVVPCYNTPKKYFEPLLASVFAQGYSNWELIIVDASDKLSSKKYLNNKSESDKRIKYVEITNEGIAQNTNKGISEAQGELIAFLDHDDTLDPNALYESVFVFDKHPDTGLVYSDEDKVSDDGSRYFQPHFKPDFSLDMLRSVNYITHFVVARKSLVKELSGIRKGVEGAQDYDFLLRMVDQGAKVRHVPKALYHWRQAQGSTAADFSSKKHITDAGRKALSDHFKRRAIDNVNVHAISNRPGFYTREYALDESKRFIHINIQDDLASKAEKNFVLEQYQKNKDVIKHGIEVTDKTPEKSKNWQHHMVVKDMIIPANENTDIAVLFGLAEEAGVSGVAPAVSKSGRVHDYGIVKAGGAKKYLFRGVDPTKLMPFGSLEWARNVDELTGAIAISNDGDEDAAKRKIIWPHSQFVHYSPVKDTEKSGDNRNYYNPNIEELVELSDVPTNNTIKKMDISK